MTRLLVVVAALWPIASIAGTTPVEHPALKQFVEETATAGIHHSYTGE